MIGGNDKITKGQNAGLVIGSVLGVGILSLPKDLADIAGPDGVFLLIIATIIIILLVIVHSKIALKFPGKTLVEIMNDTLPKPIALMFIFIFIFFYLGAAASVVRVFSEGIKMFMLSRTPLEVIIMTMLLTNVYIVRQGIEPIARIVQIVLPLAIIPFFLISLALIPDLKMTNMLPLFQIGIKEVFQGLKVAAYSFIGTEIILISTAYVKDTKNALKYNILSTVFLGFIYIFIFIIVVTQFGIKQTADLLWPTLFLMKTVDIPGAFLENVEGIFITIWTLIALQGLAVILIQESIVISKALKLKESNFISMPLLPVIYVLAVFPENIAEVYDYMNIFSNYLGTVVALGIPLVLFIVLLFKKKGTKKA
ncbi:endospore germination permease [Clostridium sp. D2Q-14]|uniref:GerAB/ArcD/ProY family transporter n=1 Tax=Anaeromonas gelatinilytica TaxID=2683194 RepID=UPI00193BFC6D|nr:endospore germination permease [Anaeromonas gelatinilytica]MBS4535138.1 endospore germination permease [Anaeromonas gelatinilytica]